MYSSKYKVYDINTFVSGRMLKIKYGVRASYFWGRQVRYRRMFLE